MFIDLTLPLSLADFEGGSDAQQTFITSGHAGTHFDVVDKSFPLDCFRLRGKVVDVSHIRDREVEIADVAHVTLEEGDFLIFHSGWVGEIGYSVKGDYLERSAGLSEALVRHIVASGVRLIGVDANGAMELKKHYWVDTYCAERGVFIIENMNNVKRLVDADAPFTVYTAPLARTDLSGLPCRVIAEIAA